jgi:two-component sensor histidine kinase
MDAEPLVVADVDAADAPAGMEALSAEGVRAVAFVPIATSTGAEGGFLICSSKPHAFGKHESEVALSISRQIGFAIERERTEKQRELLMVELSHRVKNTLANVLAIAQQTFRGADELRRQSFEGRILALGQTHTRLAEANWRGVALKTMLHDELAPYREMDDGTITLTGPPVTLTPRAAVILGMAFHELATNASKYGALSRRSGRLDVSWAIDGPSLVTRWHEMGGPAVAEPKHTGFGRMLIERALTSDLCSSVKLQFEGDGVTCEMVLPLDRSIATG